MFKHSKHTTFYILQQLLDWWSTFLNLKRHNVSKILHMYQSTSDQLRKNTVSW